MEFMYTLRLFSTLLEEISIVNPKKFKTRISAGSSHKISEVSYTKILFTKEGSRLKAVSFPCWDRNFMAYGQYSMLLVKMFLKMLL